MSAAPMTDLSNVTDIRDRMAAIALNTLGYRALAYLSVLLMTGSFVWAMVDSTVMHLVTASIFSVMMMVVFMTAMISTRRREA